MIKILTTDRFESMEDENAALKAKVLELKSSNSALSQRIRDMQEAYSKASLAIPNYRISMTNGFYVLEIYETYYESKLGNSRSEKYMSLGSFMSYDEALKAMTAYIDGSKYFNAAGKLISFHCDASGSAT